MKLYKSEIAYIAARNRHYFFDLIVTAFKESGSTVQQLADDLGWSVEDTQQFLGRPRNHPLDVYSAVYATITGGRSFKPVPWYSIKDRLDNTN